MSTTSLVEGAKKLAGQRAVAEHFDPSFTHVGIGSGSTITYVVEAIAAQLKSLEKTGSDEKASGSNPSGISFVPTGYQSKQVIIEAGLFPVTFDQLPDDVVLDVAFDGADEVDDDLNCIKGGGACLFQEKLVAQRAKKFVCVADFRKAQSRLLTKWPSVPIEVAPISAPSVLQALKLLGSVDPKIRLNPLAKSGPLKTDQDFYIIDAPFPKPLLIQGDQGSGDGKDESWHVEALAKKIKDITGVLEVGLFCGYDGVEKIEKGYHVGGQKPVAVYFGMEDGSVTLRARKGGLTK